MEKCITMRGLKDKWGLMEKKIKNDNSNRFIELWILLYQILNLCTKTCKSLEK